MKVVVLGCGPAGVVAATGLARIGYSVSVIGQARGYPVMEGISPRVCQSLSDHGLDACLSTLSAPVERVAAWNGEVRAANREYLVDRLAFETALLEDLSRHGVNLLRRRIRTVERAGERWHIESEAEGELLCSSADFLVDARGRAANLARIPRVRGPETVSLAANWECAPAEPFTAVASVEQGWLWLARTASGSLFAQFTTGAGNAEIPGKRGIRALIRRQLDASEFSHLEPKLGRPRGEAMARSSTAILVENPVEDHSIRVGDAAMAVDPLSGNGIFQSLSSALVAPAVINTILKRSSDAELAMGFYRERLKHLFFRFARTGRDFYQLEELRNTSAFWLERATWPDLDPAHIECDEVIGTALRPVLNQHFIETAEVVLTANQPLGIWRVGDKAAGDLLAASGNRQFRDGL